MCFTPYELLVVIGYSTHTIDFTTWYYHLIAVLMFSNSIINPFIYAAKYREFQQGVRRLLSKMKQQSRVSSIT